MEKIIFEPMYLGPYRVILEFESKRLIEHKKPKKVKIDSVYHPAEIHPREDKVSKSKYQYSSLNKLSNDILCTKIQ